MLFKVAPSGDPILRGYCSACSDANFLFAVNTEENQRLMQLASTFTYKSFMFSARKQVLNDLPRPKMPT